MDYSSFSFFLVVVLLVLMIPIIRFHLSVAEDVSEIKIAVKEGDFKKAKLLLAKLPVRSRNTSCLLYVQYWVSLKQENYHMALYYLDEIKRKGIYDESMEMSKKSIDFLKIDVYEAMGNVAEVIEMCRKITAQDPQNLVGYEKLSVNLFKIKNYEEALPFFRQAILKNSKDWKVYEMYSKILLMKNQYEDAFLAINKAIDLLDGKKNCYLLEQKFICLYYMNDFKGALACEGEIDSIYKKSVETKAALGICNYQSGFSDEALNIFNSILNKYLTNTSPEVMKARVIYGKLLLKEKELRKAIDQLSIIEKLGQADGMLTEKKIVLESLEVATVLNSMFVSNDAAIIQKTVSEAVDWKYFLQESFIQLNSKSFILIVRKIGSGSSGILFFLFYFGLDFLTISEITPSLKKVQNLLANKKNSHVYFCSLFPLEEQVVKQVMSFFPKIDFIYGTILLAQLKHGKFALDL